MSAKGEILQWPLMLAYLGSGLDSSVVLRLHTFRRRGICADEVGTDCDKLSQHKC